MGRANTTLFPMLTDRFLLPEALPLYRKALEVLDLVDHILAVAPDSEEEDNPLQFQMQVMHANAILLAPKIANAEGADLYDLRMENATLIRKAARDLLTDLRGLEMFGYHEPRYFNLLRDELEEFRKLFVAWIRAFDPFNSAPDPWGMFNPPGMNPGDDFNGDPSDFDEDSPF